MDLNKFSGLAKTFDEGTEITIMHPVTGEKTDLKVRVASYQSERCKKVQRRLANTAIRENKRNPKKVGTAEEIEAKTNEVVASAVISWSGFMNGTKVLECTPENVMAILENDDLWFIGEQIDKAADDITSFIKA